MRVAKGVESGGQFAASVRGEAGVGLASKHYTLLDEPEVTETPGGAKVTNRVAAPITSEDGIFAYASICAPDPSRYVSDDLPGIPGQAYYYSGDAGARDGVALMRIEGMARSQAEGWDRVNQAHGEWGDRFDARTSEDRARNNDWVAENTRQRRTETAQRLAAADDLNTVVEHRKTLPKVGVLPRKRRAIADAEADVAMAWSTYRKHYPDARASGASR